jgi:hypothetical protein
LFDSGVESRVASGVLHAVVAVDFTASRKVRVQVVGKQYGEGIGRLCRQAKSQQPYAKDEEVRLYWLIPVSAHFFGQR